MYGNNNNLVNTWETRAKYSQCCFPLAHWMRAAVSAAAVHYCPLPLSPDRSDRGPLSTQLGSHPQACPGFLTKETSACGGRLCMQISSWNRDGVGRGCVPRDKDCRVYCREHLPSNIDTASREPSFRRVSGIVNALLAEQVSVLQYLMCW